MVSTMNNTNNDGMEEDQILMIQALQAQMEELRHKGIVDQLRHEEDRRKQKEKWHRKADEVAHLKEQNMKLLEQIGVSVREEQSHISRPPTHQTHQVHQTQHTCPTHPTHQSSKNVVFNNEENYKDHPFTNDIIVVPLPDKWRGLTMNLYDCSTDPDEHLNIFKTHMTLYTVDQTVWCKVFPTSLREGPLGWFTKLPANSVMNFKVLETKFTTQYKTSRPHRVSSMCLLNVKQEKGESLRAFMERFSKVYMGIRNLNPEIAMHHLISAILLGRFTESLIKQPPYDMDELRTRATKFMQIEEHIDYHRKTQVEASKKERERNRGIRPPITGTDRFRTNRGPPFHHYTPLTMPRGKMLDEALQAELILTLKQAQTPSMPIQPNVANTIATMAIRPKAARH